MKENTQEKSLVQVNENGIFYKIKKFFKNLFNRNANTTNNYAIVKETESLVANENKKNSFMESIKNIEAIKEQLLKQKDINTFDKESSNKLKEIVRDIIRYSIIKQSSYLVSKEDKE